ncbi:hypothetical protein FPOA_27978 [Fusarium poae]|uniref:HAT C-terminal dimerisation domain-containing protein n=1 Tax=Fusarium poae TaxID=36050 RepID=A0A1B8A632_FUSPO|nr:hypothetical protein FPOA_27978 [Fusarium poae]
MHCIHGIELEAHEHPIKKRRDRLIQDAFAKAGDMHAAKQLAKREETLRHAINHKAALEALIQLVTVRNLSYNCSSWPELHALISAVNPAADDLISLSHGSIQKLVSNSFRVHKDMLRRKLQSTPWKLHLSSDVRSAPNHKAFLGICVKFVDPDAKEALQALLALSELPGLDGPGSHGGAEQWKLLQHVLEDYNIWNKVGFYTGDNHGSNDKLCHLLANYLQGKGVDWEAKTRRIRCHGHIVNLAVQAFLFIDSKEAARAALEHIEDTDESAFGTDFSERIKPQRAQGWRRLGPLGKVHNISIHMRENDYRWNEFKKRAGRSLGLDNDTRWNSWFLLLDTTLNLQNYVEWYQKKYYQDLRDDYLTPDEWSALGETRAFLQPFWKQGSNPYHEIHIWIHNVDPYPFHSIPQRTEEDNQRLFQLYKGWTLTERDGQVRQWVYQFGYDIQHAQKGERRWVCCLCIKQKRPRPKSYAIKGLQNAEGHLYTDHNGIMDPTGKRQKPAKASEKAHQSIATILQLNPKEPKEQDLINTLIKRFDKTVFQQKLVNWIVNSNQSFWIVNDQDLRDIFNYLNPSVEITKANITDVTVRAISEREFTNNMERVKDAFEKEVFEGLHTAAKEHEVWRRRGSVGKWHNFAVEVSRSDTWTDMLKKVQAVESQLSDDAQLKKHRPVGVVVDNATRWLSQFSMIERALALRPFYNSFVQRASNEWEKNRMTADDWHVLGTLYDILLDFQLVVRGLEGDGQGKHQRKVEENEIDPPLSGTSWDLVHAHEFLLETLESGKRAVANFPDGHHLAVNINLGWLKLNEYYEHLNDSPLIYGAAVLHPAYRWALFDDLWGDDDERQLWITKAKEMVQDLWEREYRDLEVDDPEIELPANKRLKTSRNKFTAWRTKKRGLTAGGISVTESPIQSPAQSPRSSVGGLDLDEYEQWQRDIEDADASVTDPYEYWHIRRLKYPRLSRMALDLLTVPPMPAECERLFSTTGRMVTKSRNRLDASTIGLCQTLRSWLRAGLIGSLDRILMDE